ARLPHSATDVMAGTNMSSTFPFGTPPIQPLGNYTNPGDASITVNNPDLPQIAGGFDGSGNSTSFTNQPFNIQNYEIQYSTTNAEGETGPGIGNLPANVKIQQPTEEPEESQVFDRLFDPRAQVIFLDASKENPDLP